VLARLWTVVLARLRRRCMRARDDVEIVIASQYHVFPLGERRQSHICDGSLERRLLCVLFAFGWGEQVFVEDVKPTVAARYRLLCDAYEG
jgi:hypothetical protein